MCISPAGSSSDVLLLTILPASHSQFDNTNNKVPACFTDHVKVFVSYIQQTGAPCKSTGCENRFCHAHLWVKAPSSGYSH